MKIALLSTDDINSGAGIAAYRLHKGLSDMGVDSSMLVALKTGSDLHKVFGPLSFFGKFFGYLAPDLDSFPLHFYKDKKNDFFSTSFFYENTSSKCLKLHPDLVHLHWICGGFLRIESLRKLNRPIVWTLHDMWPFTGGCHYSGTCDKFAEQCGDCPVLCSALYNDLSHKIWKRKQDAWRDLDITIVTPSRWLAEKAKKSSLFKNRRVEVIPNGIDLNRYKPVDQRSLRTILNLPLDKRLILFGAVRATMDERKGFQYLQKALLSLSDRGWKKNTEVIVFGDSQQQNPPDFGLKTHYMGRSHNDISISLLYGAADVFVAPSTQDNLPNTLLESLACGTPAVGFDVGGIPEIIEHKKSGYLAEPRDTIDLASGIGWTLSDLARHSTLRVAAREKALREYSIDMRARQYSSLYEDILNGRNNKGSRYL